MGTSVNNGEPVMDTNDWGTQLSSDSRQKIVNKILETLKKHLPFSEPEGINELKRIAARFEEKVFSSAVHQTDYLRKISLKMLIMETKDQNTAGSSSSIPADSNNPALDELDSLMINVERFLLNEEPAMSSGDWRAQLPPDSRQKNVDKLMETLEKHVPYLEQEGIEEVRRIAISFEELIFNTALNQVDYFRKISLKMQTMEEDN
ncbi:mediator of RNA polymerase II transcription subunit 15a-like [Brassica napus]|uniref:mediator of RNA polymerase II transcription subunit 15a-like n=1 Tax=Brassica napus TaxID=3708 RepID=UPI0006AAD51C|nr:mediator of RNA polymerase II transcription subunit 15a-like [Brassica napus]XP_013641713.1 mediator of RNA polymerase II transcription subunit 15a-like [Brassica napus]